MSTYVPIQAITLSADTASITFTGIPQTYTDLVLVMQLGVAAGAGDDIVGMRFNSDTGSNYSDTQILGNGSAASSGRGSNRTYSLLGRCYLGVTATLIANIQNYSNNTTNKTVINRYGNANTTGSGAVVSLWRNTSAVTSITLFEGGAGSNFSSGSTFTLYGVGTGSPLAFGGDEVRTDGTYWYHIFRSSGRFEPVQNLSNVDYLVVAGGASGAGGGGGGGAGGLRCTVGATGGGGSLESPLSLNANSAYTVTVGAGGAATTTAYNIGNNGSNSVFATITSIGGGAGGAADDALDGRRGQAGGSGGGGGYNASTGEGAGGAATTGQGFAGGSVISTEATGALIYAAGGGGAGAAGANVTNVSVDATNGGIGVQTSISGTATYYAGGGGGGIAGTGSQYSDGGLGGGGGGRTGAGVNATANTGGGGGGTGGQNGTGVSGAGGSGIVIIRYAV